MEILRRIDRHPQRSMDVKELKQQWKARDIEHLVRKGHLRQRGSRLCSTSSYHTGVLHVHPDGFGFVRVAGRGEDIYMPAREVMGLMHGDRIEIALQRVRGRQSGRFVRVLREASSEITARIEHHGSIVLAVPRVARFPWNILIDEFQVPDVKDGDWVRVRLQRGSRPLRGTVVRRLGQNMDAGELIELAMREHELPDAFPDAVLRQARSCPVSVDILEYTHRQDLTHLPFVTIDGERARDFDDAICVLRRGNSFELWVAIADVAHYVPLDSAMDREARLRGNSFYLPDRVVPMLPEALSHELCSLNPHQPRLAMVVRMRIDAARRRHGVRIYEGIIRSRARLNYAQVARWLEEGDATALPDPALRAMLRDAADLSCSLLRSREERGALDLDLPESEIELQDGEVMHIRRSERTQAHRLIEEMMLITNISVAEELEKHERGLLYRVHPAPEPAAIERLNEFLGPQGMHLPAPRSGKRSHPADWQKVLRRADSEPWGHVLHRLMLRSMQQACYAPRNQGHFGLSYRSYTHFTSPIRRYADLCVHRQVKAMLRQDSEPFDTAELEAIAKHVSEQERVAQRLEWDVRDMLAALYHHQHLDETVPAVISGVGRRRIFFELLESLAEASMPLERLSGRFVLDEHRHCLRSSCGRTLLSLGDAVRVRIERCDPVWGRIDVVLREDGKRHRPG